MTTESGPIRSAADQAIAAEIRAFRGRKGWTREQLATRSGINLVTLERYENAKRAIPATAVAVLAEALGCTMSDLVRSAEQQNPGAFKFKHLDVTQAEDLD